jgi:adenine-specific DNA-methyltransferase
MTGAERKLWYALRDSQLGVKFRRQHPLGCYVVDFYSEKFKLAVEVDGGQHAESKADAVRTAWLEAQGCRVLRFWNNDVLGNLPGVLENIRAALPNPLTRRFAPTSPRGRGKLAAP